ncbi:MAG: transposase [Bacteroidota bacterium]
MQNRVYYRRKNQVHIQPIGAKFSVTILAFDAVPNAKLDQVHKEYRHQISLIDSSSSENKALEKKRAANEYQSKFEALLAAKNNQSHPFSNPEVADCILKQLDRHNGEWYTLEAAIVMSNHIHFLIDTSVQLPDNTLNGSLPDNYMPLNRIVGRIKGAASFEINKRLDRTGPLWSSGYYDRYIRSPSHFQQAAWYILMNAEKAGIVDEWEAYLYVRYRPGLLEEIAWTG